MGYKYLMFDLDGTLTNSGPGIANSVRYALEKRGIHETDEKKLLAFVGPPLVDSFQKYYGFTLEESKAAIFDYRDYFVDKGIFENELYPGMLELLERLKAAGKRLFVATSKPEPFAKQVIEYFHISHCFEAVAGPGLEEKSHKKAKIIRRNLADFQISDLEHTVMIGDRENDVRAARETGIRSIGVLYGYGSKEELLEAGAEKLAASLEELEKLLLA